jgi:hypothetical protein
VDKFVRNSSSSKYVIDFYQKIPSDENFSSVEAAVCSSGSARFFTFFVDKIVRKHT